MSAHGLNDLYGKIQDWLRPDGAENSDATVTVGFMTNQAQKHGAFVIDNPTAAEEINRGRVLPWYPLSEGEAERVKMLIATLRGMGIVKWDNSIAEAWMVPNRREGTT